MNTIITWFDQIDKELFLYLNSFHSAFFDLIMYWITKQETWYPFYLALIILIFWKFRSNGFLLILMIILIIVVTDQLTSGFMKPFFERLRPCHNADISNLVHMVTGCGGLYGFASSHASNSFGLAMIIHLIFKKTNRYTSWMFVWAGIVAYSRVYVGVHYPGDIIVGSLIGIISGYLVFLLFEKIFRNKFKIMNIT